MRDHLLGYLLDAVEPEERANIEQQLAQDEQLRNDLQVLRGGLHPLTGDERHHQPPTGLAQRCCEYVYNCVAVMPARLSTADVVAVRSTRRWSWLDLTVAGAIAAAVAVLLLPAIYQSHIQSQLLACQNNLKDLGYGMIDYSDRHGGYYPAMQPGDQHNASGMWGPMLMNAGYLPVANTAVCPSSKLADDHEFAIPRMSDVQQMSKAQFSEKVARFSGSYGMTAGTRKDGVYKTPQRLDRRFYTVLADAPGDKGTNSPNHGEMGPNVLLDNGAVRHLSGTRIGPDDIYTNALGEIGPGVDENDAVILQNQQPLDWNNP